MSELELIKEGMQRHRQLLAQRKRLMREFGSTHAGVIRTNVLIQGVEERLLKLIPKEILQEATEEL